MYNITDAIIVVMLAAEMQLIRVSTVSSYLEANRLLKRLPNPTSVNQRLWR